MAIGKYLQLFRSSTIYTTYELAKDALDTQVANVQDGSPLIARYTDGSKQHTLLAVKGADNKAHFIELSNDTPITNKYLKGEFAKLTVEIKANEEGLSADDAKVVISETVASETDGHTTFTIGLSNAASKKDLADQYREYKITEIVDKDANSFAEYKLQVKTSKEGDFANADGSTIVIPKDKSLEKAEFVTQNEEGKNGQFLKLTYNTANGTQQDVYVDMSTLIVEAEAGDGLKIGDNGTLNIVKAEDSENFLVVSADNIAIKGVQNAINASRTTVSKADGETYVSVSTASETDSHFSYIVSTTDDLKNKLQNITSDGEISSENVKYGESDVKATIDTINNLVTESLPTQIKAAKTEVSSEDLSVTLSTNQEDGNNIYTISFTEDFNKKVSNLTDEGKISGENVTIDSDKISSTTVTDAINELATDITEITTNAIGVQGGNGISVTDSSDNANLKVISLLKADNKSQTDTNILEVGENGVYVSNIWDCGTF